MFAKWSSKAKPWTIWQTSTRFVFASFIFSLLLSGFLLIGGSFETHLHVRYPPPHRRIPPAQPVSDHIPNVHPIDVLMERARRTQRERIQQRSSNIDTAAYRYRLRRGRHPPPGFDKWVEYALKHDAIIVEDFFDRIYLDLAPYWALKPGDIASRAASWDHLVRVRDGIAQPVGDLTGRVPWLRLWTGLVLEAAPYLPDVDMPINYMDEPRLLVPWEKIEKYRAKERRQRKLPQPEKVVKQYTGLKAIDARRALAYEPVWLREAPKFWDYLLATCPRSSPSRKARAARDSSVHPTVPSDWQAPYAFGGFVKDVAAAADHCTQPHLRWMHGTFTEPMSLFATKELIPMFGGSKLQRNHEIIIPGAMYLSEDVDFNGGPTGGPAWEDKNQTTALVWRGVSSGGRIRPEDWAHFQRHRLVEMLNGTTVSRMESTGMRAATFDLPRHGQNDFPQRSQETLGSWLSRVADAGFVHKLCDWRNCSSLEKHFSLVDFMPMGDQLSYKLIADVDGNSYSARFRGLLLSTSLPLKATVYAEWHDDRLVPWLHFVPFDNSFQDLYAVLDYFTRDQRGDDAARHLAFEGRAWAEKVLRREDMLLYVWRLLLEFARVCDKKRDYLGYVDDLLSTTGGPQVFSHI